VAVAAINAIVADVMFVTELDWLLFLDPLPGVPGRTIQLNGDPQQGETDEHSAIDRDLRQRVRAVMENLGHCLRIREGTSHRYHWETQSPTNLSHSGCLLQSAFTLPNRSRFSNRVTFAC
jgi:hypothetical protein